MAGFHFSSWKIWIWTSQDVLPHYWQISQVSLHLALRLWYTLLFSLYTCRNCRAYSASLSFCFPFNGFSQTLAIEDRSASYMVAQSRTWIGSYADDHSWVLFWNSWLDDFLQTLWPASTWWQSIVVRRILEVFYYNFRLDLQIYWSHWSQFVRSRHLHYRIKTCRGKWCGWIFIW